ERSYFITYIWNALAVVTKYAHLSIPVLFLVVYFISVYFTFLGLFLVAMTLFGRVEVALLSLFFLLFNKYLLGTGYFTDYLDAIIIATPVLLFALNQFLRGKYVSSYILQGVAFLIHPLSAVYVIAMLAVCSAALFRIIGWQRLAWCIAGLLLVASPSIIWKLGSSPASSHLLRADAPWVELLKLRSPHHLFPFLWPIGDYFRTALLLYAFFICWKHPPRALHHRIITYSTFSIFGLWLVAAVSAQLLPVAIVIQLQLFRSSNWLLPFAYCYYAN